MEINAVFEGGGVKGIALAGAVAELERRCIAVRRMAGTSSGSIIASFLAAGFTAGEIEDTIKRTPFRSFLKRGRAFGIPPVGPLSRLLWKKGLYSGDAIEQWIREALMTKGIRTFNDLPIGKLTVIASDITNGKLLVLPGDIAHYGIDPMRLEVARAVRMSTSIPYFFDPVILRQSVRNPDRPSVNQFAYIVDGALLSNFPLWLFDGKGGAADRIPTIGFQLVGKNDNEPRKIRGPLSMLQAIFETMLEAHDERYIEKHNRLRTVKIPTLGVRNTQFDLSEEWSGKLFNSGRERTAAFFDEYLYRIGD
jgi:NTE family protein